MDSYTIEVYLDDVNKEYLNKLSFLTLFRSRSLGFRCSADMFSEAFREHSDSISDATLSALLTCHIARHISKSYDIEFKDDLIYLLRHPSLLNYKLDPNQKQVRKKVLRFYDINASGNEHKKEAFEFLDNMRPVKRAAYVDRIVDQYLILNCHSYYVSQAAARILDDLVKKSKFDSEGQILSPAKELVETIWSIGKTMNG